MSEYALDLWERAKDALRVAGHDLPVSPDASASRSYYAVFYAVSALFALQGKEFRRHSAVEAAVHRDLVKPGNWPPALGQDYSVLLRLRGRGDYGRGEHVTPEEAQAAMEAATRIVEAVRGAHPEFK